MKNLRKHFCKKWAFRYKFFTKSHLFSYSFFIFISDISIESEPIKPSVMAAKYIVRKRQNKILYTEFFFAALASGMLAFLYFKLHPAIALSVGIASIFLFAFLFFANGIFRYLFSILFSFGWAFIAFFTGHAIEAKTDTTAWIFAIIAFALSLCAHWNHFTFLKQARLYEYEFHG